MAKIKISSGTVHTVPADLNKALNSTPGLSEAWNDLTPLARNEWICWIISVKKIDTRNNHIERACQEIGQGKRRPCCWPGCAHR